MDAPHDVDTWLRELAGRPRVFNHNPRLGLAEFQSFELANEVTIVNADGATERVYLFSRKGGKDEALLRVSLCDHDTTQQALAGLGTVLAHTMNPDIARADVAKAADVGFAVQHARGQAQGSLGAAVFSIGNVSVTVHSAGARPVNVAAAAAHVGKLLSGEPDKAALRARRVQAYAPAPVQLAAGEAITLVETLPDDRPDADRIQLMAPDGEFRRDGRSLVYVARKGGPQPISLFMHRQS